MVHHTFRWICKARLEKYRTGEAVPYEVIDNVGNLLTYSGASALWDLLIGAGNVDPFDNANAHIGVGDGADTAASADTGLDGTNTFFQPMDATFPTHTDGSTSGNRYIQFQSTILDGDAEFDWTEWGVFNALSGGRILNHAYTAFGVKAPGDDWRINVQLELTS